MQESYPNPKKESALPFSFHIRDESGAFHIVETASGILSVEVVGVGGEKIVLNDLLPEGYEVVGNKIVANDISRFGLGLADIDTSLADVENKAIVVSEREVRREGRKYILTFLHELGHIMRHHKHPELREERNSASHYSDRNPNNVEAFKRAEALIAADERDAWAFAVRAYKKLLATLGLPEEKIFKNADGLKRWIYQTSLGAKADAAAHAIHEDIFHHFSALSKEEKKRLAAEITKMYMGKKSASTTLETAS